MWGRVFMVMWLKMWFGYLWYLFSENGGNEPVSLVQLWYVSHECQDDCAKSGEPSALLDPSSSQGVSHYYQLWREHLSSIRTFSRKQPSLVGLERWNAQRYLKILNRKKKNKKTSPSMMVHVFNPSTWEVQVGGSLERSGLCSEILSKKKLQIWS